MSTGEKTADREFLERLDAAIGCMQCTMPLGEHAVSDYYCSEECSRQWTAERTDHHADYIDDDAWDGVDVSDLEPVSWIAPPAWRLPRSTGDLDADREACDHASMTATTASQRAACILRNENIHRRQRVIWAREWRLPRATGDFWKDNRACNLASSTATTPAQVAACELRRIEIQNYKPRFDAQTRWEFDPDFSPIVRSRISWDPSDISNYGRRPDAVDEVPFFGERRLTWNLPGVQRASIEISGIYRPPEPTRHLTYELRRDSDDTLMASYAVPDGQQFSIELPNYFDTTGCSWRILNSHGEVIRQFPATSPRLWTTPDPAPAVDEGDTIQITRNGETLRYTVDAIGPGSSMTLRRHSEDNQPPIPGATS